MTQRSSREPDRRKHARIEPKGTVTLHALDNVHRGRLMNIGSGGLYVATDVTVPVRLLDRVVDLELRFDGPLAAWQRRAGRVSRIDADGVAIVFDAPTAGLLGMIDDLATASHASARVISVVLIDADAPRRATIAAAFRMTGCQVIEATTSLEAIVRLGESHFEPDVIAVANPQTGTTNEMRAFIEREHPNSMLVTIGPELLDPAGLANWLSSANASADLPARIRTLILTPRISAERRGGGA
ncbi:MAG TPA: PilZ domain-containing protein, partial [Gemmatimonadaceae bacterium]|nr:PilZ domain-containing protein [Gemmatimonadaceae bacterium]